MRTMAEMTTMGKLSLTEAKAAIIARWSSPAEIARRQQTVRATLETKTIISLAWFGNIRLGADFKGFSLYLFNDSSSQRLVFFQLH